MLDRTEIVTWNPFTESMKKKLRKWLEKIVGAFGWSLVETAKLSNLARLAAETKAAVSLETHLSRLLSQYSPDCLFDVGAHDGGFARMVRRLGYTGWIVSFEPLPHLAKKLREQSDGDEKWRIEECALGAKSGEMMFHQMASDVFSSFLLPESGQPEKYVESNALVGSHLVKVSTVETVWKETKVSLGVSRLMLKMDTQGFDLEVFCGVGDVAGDICLLMSELACIPIYQGAPVLTQSLETFGGAGFRPAFLSPISFDQDLAAIEMDGVFVRNGISGQRL